MLSYKDIDDMDYLSRLLELYLAHLESIGYENNLRALAWHSGIPAHILTLLCTVYRIPEVTGIASEDFHTVLDRLTDQHPAQSIWLDQITGEAYVRI